MPSTDTPAPWHLHPPWRTAAERDRYERERIKAEIEENGIAVVGASRLMRREEWELWQGGGHEN